MSPLPGELGERWERLVDAYGDAEFDCAAADDDMIEPLAPLLERRNATRAALDAFVEEVVGALEPFAKAATTFERRRQTEQLDTKLVEVELGLLRAARRALAVPSSEEVENA